MKTKPVIGKTLEDKKLEAMQDIVSELKQLNQTMFTISMSLFNVGYRHYPSYPIYGSAGGTAVGEREKI